MQFTNIGAYIKPIAAIFPQSAAAGALNGVGIDRTGYESCVLSGSTGAASGAPTAQTFDLKLQHSPDGVAWTDVAGAALTTITTVNTGGRVNVDLSVLARYIRGVATIGLTGGSTPGLLVHSTIVLGGANSLPTP